MWMERESRTRSGVFARGMSCGLLPCPRIFRREMCRCRMVKMTCFISGKFIPQLCFGTALISRAILGCFLTTDFFCWVATLKKSCVQPRLLIYLVKFSLVTWNECMKDAFGGCIFPPPNLGSSFSLAVLLQSWGERGRGRDGEGPWSYQSWNPHWNRHWALQSSTQAAQRSGVMLTAAKKHQTPASPWGAAAWCHVDVKQAGTKANTQCLVCCGLAFLNFPFLMVPYQQQWEHPDNFCLYFFVCCEKAREALRLQSLPLLMCWVWFASE